MEGKVLPSKILVSEKKKEDKVTPSGIIISAAVSSKDPCVTGIVEMTGEGAPIIGMPVSIGNTVLFSPHAFQRVRYQEKDFMLLDIRDVLLFF
jgi:co-chaperonin GroES (HSP10)